jgi:RecB family endonuclease NucS
MLQANIDVINGKLSIEEARNKTRESLEINNSEILHLASAQIEYDLTNGISRKLEDYLNYELLLDERDKYSKKQ